jgi:hypothetical protein
MLIDVNRSIRSDPFHETPPKLWWNGGNFQLGPIRSTPLGCEKLGADLLSIILSAFGGYSTPIFPQTMIYENPALTLVSHGSCHSTWAWFSPWSSRDPFLGPNFSLLIPNYFRERPAWSQGVRFWGTPWNLYGSEHHLPKWNSRTLGFSCFCTYGGFLSHGGSPVVIMVVSILQV